MAAYPRPRRRLVERGGVEDCGLPAAEEGGESVARRVLEVTDRCDLAEWAGQRTNRPPVRAGVVDVAERRVSSRGQPTAEQ